MATVKNISTIPLELPGGRLLLPGQSQSSVNAGDVAWQIADGLLAEVKSTSKRSDAAKAPAEQKEN